jgi:hypothetical protein
LRKLCALIRANFGIDPHRLGDEEFITLATEAEFIEQYRAQRNKAAMLEALGALWKK